MTMVSNLKSSKKTSVASLRSGGRFTLEQVARIKRNGWPICSGMGGRNGAEYAITKYLIKYSKEYTVYVKINELLKSYKDHKYQIKILKNAFNELPDHNKEILTLLSEAYILNKYYDKAEEAAKELIKKYPTVAGSLGSLAAVYREMKNYDDEIKIHLEALDKFPDNKEEILKKLIEANISAKEYDKAEEAAKELIKLKPDETNTYAYLASTYRESKNYEKEIEVHKEVIQKFPDVEAAALQQIVNAFINLKQYDKAEEAAKELIKKYPTVAGSLGSLAAVYREMKNYDDEIKIHLEALGKFPDNEEEILKELADAYNLVDKSEEAIKILEQLIKINPQEEYLKLRNSIIERR